MTYGTPHTVIQIYGWCGHHLTSDTPSETTLIDMQMLWIQCILINLIQRLSKAALLPVRRLAHQKKWTALYYWSDHKLEPLRAVYILPLWYYRRLYQACMWLVAVQHMQKLADRAIHTIPYHIRFEVA